MSHLKEYRTSMKNLRYLEKALNRLKISYKISGQNLILPQTEKNNASFCWNGKTYILIYDRDYWINPLTINSFIENVIREYSIEKVAQDMKKFGFDANSYKNYSKSNDYHTVKTKKLILSRYTF